MPLWRRLSALNRILSACSLLAMLGFMLLMRVWDQPVEGAARTAALVAGLVPTIGF